LDQVEAAAVPHARAAVAWREVELEGDLSLAELSDRVEEALARRASVAAPAAKGPADAPIRGLWDEVLPGEEGLAWTVYLSHARRAVHEDAVTDVAICVLEAAARVPDARRGLLEEGLDHDDRLVRWTAARLLQGLGRPGEWLGRASRDQDPLVRARSRLPGSAAP
jgi:hypothetical protein